VYANAAGQTGQGDSAFTLLGHSQVAVPYKGAVQRCDHNRETMFLQTVDTAILADAEKAYEIRQDLKKGLVMPTR
jgi:predicted amidohydrolase